jgi:hypothetical protein
VTPQTRRRWSATMKEDPVWIAVWVLVVALSLFLGWLLVMFSRPVWG